MGEERAFFLLSIFQTCCLALGDASGARGGTVVFTVGIITSQVNVPVPARATIATAAAGVGTSNGPSGEERANCTTSAKGMAEGCGLGFILTITFFFASWWGETHKQEGAAA